MRTDSFVPRIAALLTLSVAPFLLPGIAAAQVPPPPEWYRYAQPIPIEDGEFYVPGGTLGSLSIAVADNGIVGGALYFYSDTGELIVQAISGTLVRNDDDTVRETGEIAYVDLDTYALSNGPCRGCAYHGRDQVLTSDVTHLAWVAPRTIEFTVNGMTETAVGLVNGPPLLPTTDLSGTWLRVIYSEKISYARLAGDPNSEPEHHEKVELVRLTRLPGDWSFTFADGDLPVSPPYFDLAALPTPGADLYELECADVDCVREEVYYDFGSDKNILWMDSGHRGRVMPVRTTGATSAEVFDYGMEVPRLYLSGDRMVGRAATHRGEPLYFFEEQTYVRVPEAALGGDWRFLRCLALQDLPPEDRPPCNP